MSTFFFLIYELFLKVFSYQIFGPDDNPKLLAADGWWLMTSASASALVLNFKKFGDVSHLFESCHDT